MSLFYILNYDNYRGDMFDIGDVMDQFSDDLYQKTGLCLDIYAGITSEEMSRYLQIKNIEYLTEEVLWKNITDEEKTSKIIEYIRKINDDEKELLITDPYLFFRPQSGYKEMLINILSGSSFDKIIVFTEENKVDNQLLNDVNAALHGKLEIKYSNDFHDRYWIANRKKGFSIGSSLNGIGKKYCSLQLMDEEDVMDIVGIIIESFGE